ncbi:hypothetical protein L2E82_40358 [Cichorium intybus]|uniref:Uncharacterized protein n=1 Tax=Cichorium intybus TaxID=13427 RepID=A0ACB9ALR0_CICIN|nr:hypothetical protein L2E82_40358 [Cichorium intybus]
MLIATWLSNLGSVFSNHCSSCVCMSHKLLAHVDFDTISIARFEKQLKKQQNSQLRTKHKYEVGADLSLLEAEFDHLGAGFSQLGIDR